MGGFTDKCLTQGLNSALLRIPHKECEVMSLFVASLDRSAMPATVFNYQVNFCFGQLKSWSNLMEKERDGGGEEREHRVLSERN